MKEVNEHKIYKMLERKYHRIGCDYIILAEDEYNGLETHKKAVIRALEILNCRFASYELNIDVEEAKMQATRISVEELLQIPSDDYFSKRKKANRSYTVSKTIPYWYAFLEPPCGASYQKADFIEFNNILFPTKDNLVVYRWNDDFSNYFDAGKEWWGTGFWSIYSIRRGIFIIIGASLTD